MPSHIGIQGNERAEVLAKAALDKTKQFYHILILSTTSLSISKTFCNVNETEEMTLSYAGTELAMPISQTDSY